MNRLPDEWNALYFAFLAVVGTTLGVFVGGWFGVVFFVDGLASAVLFVYVVASMGWDFPYGGGAPELRGPTEWPDGPP